MWELILYLWTEIMSRTCFNHSVRLILLLLGCLFLLCAACKGAFAAFHMASPSPREQELPCALHSQRHW